MNETWGLTNKDNSSVKTREEFIDSLKGGLIILVVLGHVAERYLEFDLYSKFNGMYDIIYRICYSFHMPLFMVVSGYLFSMSYIDSSFTLNIHRIKRHFIDLFIVYIYMSIVTYVFKMMFSNEVLVSISSDSLLLILIKPIGYLWYLHTLLLLYLINSVVVKYVKKHRLVLLGIFFALCCISTCIDSDFIFATAICHVFRYEFFFYLGILISRFPDLFLFKKNYLIASFCVAILLEIYALIQTKRPDRILIVQLFLAYGLAIPVFVLFKYNKFFTNKVMVMLGRISFSIYLFHQYPLTFFRIVLPKLTILDGGFSLAINVFMSIMLVVIMDYIIRKIGICGLMFRPYSTFIARKTRNA